MLVTNFSATHHHGLSLPWSLGGVLGTVTKLQAGRSGILIPIGTIHFSPLQKVQTGSGTPSYPIYIEGNFGGGGKAAGVSS
jgi:hypothetical protein